MSTCMRMLITIPTIAGVSLVLVGCSESPGTVSGTVKYKGEAVTNGAVAFHMPSKGIAQNGTLDAAGKFTMAAPLPAGAYQVYYVPPAVEPQDPTKNLPPKEVKTIVPQKFHDLQGSNLSVAVKSGKNEIPIEFRD